ncbi:MAG: thioredoxin family protein [Lysinibacillus sp.]
MKTEQQYFEESVTMKEYMDNMSQLKEPSFAIYEKFELPNDGFVDQLRAVNIHILAITEDWCGDAMLNNPIIRKVAEAAGVEVRTALRDADTDLIDRHLTNGGRSIPVYLLLNEAGEVIGKWGPRAPELQAYVDEGRAKLPAQDDPTFKEATEKFYGKLRNDYATNEAFWMNVYESFKQALKPVL